MLKEERHAQILRMINKYHKVLSSELSNELNVSEDTIRRDLKELSDMGHIKKVHGGAMLNPLNPFTYKEREVYAHEYKLTIAEKAQPLIRDGNVVIMDGGTTNLQFVKSLPKDLKTTIFTNSLPIAVELSSHPTIDVMFLGGKVLKNAQVTIGIDIIEALERIKADLCFLGTRSIDVESGITEIDWEEAQVKRTIINGATKVVCLLISEKINTTNPYLVCNLQKVSTIVTELSPDDDLLKPYAKAGIDIL
jgi:DeoR family transcriptional regulator, fructose operon transcriptional repressor